MHAAHKNYLQVIEEESGVGQVEDHLLHPQAEGHRFGRVLQGECSFEKHCFNSTIEGRANTQRAALWLLPSVTEEGFGSFGVGDLNRQPL